MSQMPKPKVHMIANAHIDPVWLWVWQDGLEVAQQTCRNAADLLRKYPEYIFTRSSGAVYKWIEQTDPELFRAIVGFVEEGRWNIVNGWWVQPDCNIPCGESLVRQGLYGQLYFKERFGKTAAVGFNVDTFGHCGSLPQILTGCGLSSYVFMRPNPGEKTLPSDIFWWESQDGSRVLTCRIGRYVSPDPKDLEQSVAKAVERVRQSGMDTMCFYGRGDHGGGPTEDLVLKVKELQGAIDEAEIIFSMPDAFFRSVRESGAELPVVADDLQHHSRGCYTVVSEIKTSNRRLETSVLNAEKFCSIVWLMYGATYPRGPIRDSWEVLLFHQFHDVMGGTSIRPAYDDAARSMGKATLQVELLKEMALAGLSAKVKTVGQEGRQLLVVNPAGCEREDPIEFQRVLPSDKDLVAVDENGLEHPIQVISSEDFEGNRSVTGVFIAKLPPLGYRVFWIRGGDQGEPEFKASGHSVENSIIRISVDPETGFLSSIYDKVGGIEFLSSPSRAIVVRDESDTWSHDVVEFRDEIGAFIMDGAPLIEIGRARASVTVEGSFNGSGMATTYAIYPGQRRVDCAIELDWHEKHRMLKLSFPTSCRSAKALAEIPYGTIQRAAEGQEEPTQRWVDVLGEAEDGSPLGFLVANDCKYGYDVLGSELRVSLVRSPVYAFHRPKKVEAGKTYIYTDQGQHSIRLSLLPHFGTSTESKFHFAERLNNPPTTVFSNPHEGKYPSASSLVTCQPDNVLLGAIKLAEEEDKVIVRLFESAGRATQCTVRFPLADVGFSCGIGPWEIKTFALAEDGRVVETDMLERSLTA